jgi:hypothetical protein
MVGPAQHHIGPRRQGRQVGRRAGRGVDHQYLDAGGLGYRQIRLGRGGSEQDRLLCTAAAVPACGDALWVEVHQRHPLAGERRRHCDLGRSVDLPEPPFGLCSRIVRITQPRSHAAMYLRAYVTA